MSDRQIRASFTSVDRHIVDEGEFDLVSVGVDIGSSTSHLVFSRLHMEQVGSRYQIVERETLAESDVLLTPYVDGRDIDTQALGRFIDRAYSSAGISRDSVDTGALILTGVAARRRNARAIAELFAKEAGRFVAVSAGDGLETTMAAHGSGAVRRSGQIDGLVMNIDIGGGTSKIAICERGRVRTLTAVEIGARLIAMDECGRVARIEDAGRSLAADAGVTLDLGSPFNDDQIRAVVALMADRLIEAAGLTRMTPATAALLRLPPVDESLSIAAITFSGGVAEFSYERTGKGFGDLGRELASAVRDRIVSFGIPIEKPSATLRATVIGASQYTVQVSGSTIFIDSPATLPLRNVPVIAPAFDLTMDVIDPQAVEGAIRHSLTSLDFAHINSAMAVAFHWQGSATFKRLDDFCAGLRRGMRTLLNDGFPLVLVNDNDIGGLLGLHLHEAHTGQNPIVSIDGIELREFDFIDIGALIPASGAVPIVIKSLVFPKPEIGS